jgi:beta-lactamase superfamily II metal-dependent hydrolase
MILEIFDVEHGACALVTTSNCRRLLIDSGHNATTGWRPGTFLVRAGITRLDRLFITNYDEDHVSGYPDLLANVVVDVLVRNPSVQPNAIRHLKTEDGMGSGIDMLVRSIEGLFTGGPPPAIDDFGDTSFSFYWNSHGTPPFGMDDENNLSLVVFIKCGEHKVIFPGDIEKAGWIRLLQNQAFVQELHGVTLFVASHHGRENGYCEEVLKLCPQIQAVIISDKKLGYQSQETVDRYRKYAKGILFGTNIRHVLTTRRDSSMLFQLPAYNNGRVILGLAAA